MTTYSRVQATLALVFAIVLGTIASLGFGGGNLTLFGRTLAPLCHADASPCASCGLTRGMVAVADGDLDAGRALHPSAIAATGLLAFEVLLRLALSRLGLGRNAARLAGGVDFVVHFVVARLVVHGAMPMP